MFPLNVNVHLDVIQFPTFHRIQRKSQFNPLLSCPKVLGRKRKVAFCFFKGLSFPIQFNMASKTAWKFCHGRSIADQNCGCLGWFNSEQISSWNTRLLVDIFAVAPPSLCKVSDLHILPMPHVRVQTTQCSAGRVSQPPGVAPLHKCKERGGGRIAPTLIRTSRDLCVDTSHCIITMSETST